MFDWEKKQLRQKLQREFIDRTNIEKKLKPYGETKTYSGKQIGNVITASGVVVPVVIPLPLAAGVGELTKRKIESVKLIKTDPMDKKYKIPRLQVNIK